MSVFNATGMRSSIALCALLLLPVPALSQQDETPRIDSAYVQRPPQFDLPNPRIDPRIIEALRQRRGENERVLVDIGSFDDPVASDDVDEDTEQRAFNFVERRSRLAEELRTGRVIPVDVRRLLVKTDENDTDIAAVHYLVTHYRYEDDTGIETIVDLENERIVSQEATAHLPVQLTQREFARARELVLADEEVRDILGEAIETVELEPLVIRTLDREDPYFGHRVVRMLFKQGEDYRGDLRVEVDLTTREVFVEPGAAVTGPRGEEEEQ